MRQEPHTVPAKGDRSAFAWLTTTPRPEWYAA